jgi:ABC-2 type transport system permease protein
MMRRGGSRQPVSAIGIKPGLLRRTRSIALKEIRQAVRDRRTLTVLMLFPVMMMVIYGYALSFDIKHIPLYVLDQNRTARSRDFIESFLHSEYFDLKGELSSEREIDRVLDDSRAQVVLVIPTDFDRKLIRGEAVNVQVAIDGSNSNSAASALGYVSGIVQEYSQQVTVKAMMHSGLTGVTLPIDYRPRVWFNPELKSTRFLVPGIIVQILLMLTVLSTSLSIVREKERGTLEQLIVSPLHPLEVILGKTVPYIILSLTASLVVLTMGWLLFGVPVRGNCLLLLLATVVFLFDGLGMGLFVSTIAGTQRAAFQFSNVVATLPSFMLSGFMFPLRNMPVPIQIVSYIFPARYFLPILRGIILKGASLAVFWPELLFLVVFGAVVLMLSTWRLGRQMS